MSWASRRRAAYATGVFLFFAVLIGTPLAYWILTIPPTCTDGKRNQGETAPDRGGPCPLVDTARLTPTSVLWARSFKVRDGSYNAMAYLQNPNSEAGVRSVRYRFGLYDDRNVLVAEREGETFVMPGAVTPIFQGGIDTGNRIVARTYLEFLEPLVWERLDDPAESILINDKEITDTLSLPRVTATARNESVAKLENLTFMVTIFDPAGNAFAASQTAMPVLLGGEKRELVFTWPDPFRITAGRIDIIPLAKPVPPKQ